MLNNMAVNNRIAIFVIYESFRYYAFCTECVGLSETVGYNSI
jgi:hypothetical protein